MPINNTNLPAAKISGAETLFETSHEVTDPAICSDYSIPETSGYATPEAPSDASASTESGYRSDVDESELGEFLLDTFEVFDPALPVACTEYSV